MILVTYAGKAADTISRRPASHFQPEIQGLRAVSIVAVVWTHAGLPGLPGGFTGVDVFFVISGFLITRLLIEEIERTGGVDLLSFWARRARRLLPNAYATLIGTILLAILLFPGYDLHALREDVIWSALDVVNFLFAGKHIDYFNLDRPLSPEQHFWSLSVEEQFYIVWPALLFVGGLVLRQARPRALVLLVTVWCVSLAASIVMTASDPLSAYFHTVTRCWQLATGGLIAAAWPGIIRLPRGLRIAGAWLGLGAIVASFLLIDGDGYPGLWALLPTLGAGGLVAGFDAAAARGVLRGTLSVPPMQWIGARSYSRYLWHWPLTALPKITYPEFEHIGIIAVPVSLAIASAAYSLIEQPLHNGDLLAKPLHAFAGAAAGLVLIIAAGQHSEDIQRLWDADVANRLAQIQRVSLEHPRMGRECFLTYNQVDQPPCIRGEVKATRRAVLFGDSRAGQWFDPLDAAAKRTGWQLQIWGKGACPWPDIPSKGLGDRLACQQWREAMMARLTGPDHPDLVILSSGSFYHRGMYDRATGQTLPPDEGERLWKKGVRRNIDRLLSSGVQVAVIRDTPVADKNYRIACLLRNSSCAVPRDAATAEHFLDGNIATEFGGRVRVLDFTDDICDADACPVKRNGVVVYRDRTHITRSFALTFTPQMITLLNSTASGRARAHKVSGAPGL